MHLKNSLFNCFEFEWYLVSHGNDFSFIIMIMMIRMIIEEDDDDDDDDDDESWQS